MKMKQDETILGVSITAEYKSTDSLESPIISVKLQIQQQNRTST